MFRLLTSSPFFARHRAAAHVLSLLAASATARLLFVACLPPHTYSADVENWKNVASTLQSGQNPYNVTTFLNWPPLWMQIIFVANKLALASHFDLATVIRSFLALVESVLLGVCYGALQQLTTPERAFRLSLLGVALNPIAILLVCQHGNFDVIVGLFALLATLCIVRFNDSHDEREWLYACGCLGIATLAKTVPVVLLPLLGFGLRRVSWRSRLLGSLLVLGPITLGMSVIYALGPEQVTANVLHYRSAAGWFGLTGYFELIHWHWATELYAAAFAKALPLFLAAGVLLAFRRGRANTEELVLFALGLLAMVPGIGPGYAPQYFYWFLALIPLALVVTESPALRRSLVWFLALAIATDLIEYAMFSSHGRFLVRLFPTRGMLTLSSHLSSRAGQTLVRTPLFFSWVLMLHAVFDRALRSLLARPAGEGHSAAARTPAAIPS
jgi:hypothetical protein